MDFGLHGGSLSILVPKQAYAPGELISGRVLLSLAKPQRAISLRLELSVPGHSYHQALALSGAQTYRAGPSEYPFQIQLPRLEGAYPALWVLSASLDLPLRPDLSDHVRLRVA